MTFKVTVTVFIDDENKPTNIPDYETIIRKSKELRPLQATAINISGVRIALDKKTGSDGDVSDIWVKYGRNATMAEARTQRFVGRYLEELVEKDIHIPGAVPVPVRVPRVYLAFMWGAFGYIVSEYVDGRMCDNSKEDSERIAGAVKVLIGIRCPPEEELRPGPVGGGLIEHPFFVDGRADVVYGSVKELEDHVNGILRETGRPHRVNLSDEVAKYGLHLCPSDMKLVNFMKDGDGCDRPIVAIDFGGYSFLPPSFFAFALRDGSLAHRILTILRYEPDVPEHVTALCSASCALVPYGSNKIGIPRRSKKAPSQGSSVNAAHNPCLA